MHLNLADEATSSHNAQDGDVVYDSTTGLSFEAVHDRAVYSRAYGALVCKQCAGKQIANLCLRLPNCTKHDVIFIIKES